MEIPNTAAAKQRIVLATFGSLGDLHPYLALALELQARGHEAVIATSAAYRQKVEALGLGFRAVRPDAPDIQDQPALMKKLMNRWRGSEFVVRGLIMPAVRDSYEDTLAAADGADLLISHPLTYAVPLVAQVRQIRWISTVLSPLLFFSRYDVPMLLPVPIMSALNALGPQACGAFIGAMKWTGRSWCAPLRQLRAELGLPPVPDPMFEGQHSPELVLGLFSEVFGPRQPDWPTQTAITGFPFYDQEEAGVGIPPELAQFLDDGPPPIVFTLGSSAVMDAGRFYEQSAEAARQLGRRAVLLIGRDPRNLPKQPLPPGIAAFSYAPYSELFPCAAAIVHQGGVGTTAQALRSGRPMLVMPYAHDQPDNANRVVRLGVARTISRSQYNTKRAVQELTLLLGNPAYAQKAAEVGKRIRQENGVKAACDAIEAA